MSQHTTTKQLIYNKPVSQFGHVESIGKVNNFTLVEELSGLTLAL